MTPSLPRSNDIPQARASETKLVSEPTPDSGAVSTTPDSHTRAAVRADASASSAPLIASGPSLDADWPSLAVLSRRYIDRALEHTRGNKTRAADLLGIDRRTLNRILARERARKAAAAKAAE